ncbi:MAG TPA: LysM peptidoglycan-binding domain-containing protein [Gemmatimonadaceae bacterium]|nr:LysM peptidoglycan-binding domain-containing protein [Gemmatimonadaceae bacterium]
MDSSARTDSEFDPPARSRPPRIKKKRRIQPPTMYAIVFIALVTLAILAQFAVHMARTDPRDTRAIAERELQVNTLLPGEKVFREVSVFKRPAISYFRATRGLLVLTNKRLLYLGLEPRDLLAAPDLPPTFEERDFSLDTTVHVSSGRTFFGLAKAVVIKTPTEELRLGVPSGAWPRADILIIAMDARHDKAVANAAQQRQFLAKAEAERKAAEVERRKAKYYTVRRGDALGSIATIWNTTPDKLRNWNHLPDNRIRVGEVLLVKPAI